MGDSLYGDLLDAARDGGRLGKTPGGRGGWSRKNYSRNRQQGSNRSTGSAHPLPRTSLVREDTTFAEAVSPTSEQRLTDYPQQSSASAMVEPQEGWETVYTRKHKCSRNSDGTSAVLHSPKGFLPVVGSKRSRSPPSCNHCLRMTHKTSKCRHHLSCI